MWRCVYIAVVLVRAAAAAQAMAWATEVERDEVWRRVLAAVQESEAVAAARRTAPPSGSAAANTGVIDLLEEVYRRRARLEEAQARVRVADEVAAYRHAPGPADPDAAAAASVGAAASLEWWRAHAAHFPRVARWARGVLALAAASAPSERVCAQAGVALDKRAVGAQGERAGQRYFVQRNLDQYDAE